MQQKPSFTDRRGRAILGAVLMFWTALPATTQTVQVKTTVVVPPTTLTNPSIQLTQRTMTPGITHWNPAMIPSGAGAMLCGDESYMETTFDGKTTPKCGTIDADYVGTYKLNMNCDTGFFDPIYGGTCWKCPDDDSNGNKWQRSANSVESDDACWRVPYEKTTSATFVKKGWSWDCDSSQFWDQHDANGNWIAWGGACWSCPADYPRRTAYPVTASNACATPVNQTAPAQLLAYNGCPKPDITTMYPNKAPTDQRLPGNPFPDLASGMYVNSGAAACWACPVMDSVGNFVVTHRNGLGLFNKTGNNGCTIQFKYKPPAFPEPGLSGLGGVKEVLFEKQIFARSNALTKYLYGVAQGANLSAAAASTWVAQQWADIAQHPYQNAQIRALMLQYMLDQAPSFMYPDGNVPASPTLAEQQLVSSFQTYIQLRRTYVAQQGLYMYDSWKKDVDQYNQSHLQYMTPYFNYGDVPIDFKHTLAGIAGATAAGLGVIGGLAGASAFASGVQFVKSTATGKWVAQRATLLFGLTRGLQFFQAGIQTLGILGGATAIDAVFAIIGTIASDQFMEILTARDKLVAAVTAAQQPVSLPALLSQPMGPDQVIYFWALANSMDTEIEDGQILSMAQAANNVAKQNNYAKPQ